MITDEDPEPIAAISTPQRLFKELEDLVWEHDISWWDAVILYCEKNSVEMEALAPLINRNANLKELIAQDCEILNLLPKRTRLPGL